jgi:hypothetical protein
MKGASTIAAKLSVPERTLLLCVSSGEWKRAGIPSSVVTAAIMKGLIQRDPIGQLWLTKQGREVLEAVRSKPD